MIGYIKGEVISEKPTRLLVDVKGVGYIVNISINTYEKISGEKGVELFIHTAVKEDAITLYGFYSEAEKEMFELLISVNGIGPKIALGILSGIRIEDLRRAIKTGDVSRIVAAPGVGRKTAERMVLELRQKVDNLGAQETGAETAYSVRNEAVLALTTLGYNQKAADNAVHNILNAQPGSSLEDLIKKALTVLNK